MIEWQYYPKSDRIPEHLVEVINIFKKKSENICSDVNTLASNDVLKVLERELMSIGYQVEKSKKKVRRKRIK